MAAQSPSALDTRQRLIEAARYLFWEKGYAATGLAELLARAQANSGSFYHFFDGKDALLRVVLDTYVDMLEPYVIRPAWDATTRLLQLARRPRARSAAPGSSTSATPPEPALADDRP